ncbi:Tn3 family transposase [Parashewanella curva]|uniref:Tn3 family transposase n=1 Tax=Parashewanella curva TaxID=2338552 RepID=A0A3L8PR42_9GAMM|nr:Tn3 family transposase [Parashewanella curva]RLV57826.1 Tn3 family transposase [Parashewanella curva]
MAIDFLSDEQKAQYGKFHEVPNEAQLARYFHLDESDKEFISIRRGEHNRLGIALQLASLRFLGTFSKDVTTLPLVVKRYVAKQLSIKSVRVLNKYAIREITQFEHNGAIREKYGYHEFSTGMWQFRLSRQLYTRAWISNERPSLMFDFATAWLIQHKVLLPGVTTLTRLISSISERAANRLWSRLSALPNGQQIQKLDELLEVPTKGKSSKLDRLRKEPTTISSVSFNVAVQRYLELKAYGIQSLDFAGIPVARLKNLARHPVMTSVYKLARLSDEKRISYLVAFIKYYETLALDDAIDILDMLITSIAGEAKRLGKKKRLRTLKDLDKSALQLASVCTVLLDDDTAPSELRKEIFKKISRKKLAASIENIHSIARPSSDNFHDEMVEQYGKVSRLMPALLRDIEIGGTTAGQNTLKTYHYLAEELDSRKQFLEQPPLEIISPAWKRLVYDKEGRVTKRGYTLCFIDNFQDSIRRRDVFAKHGEKWGDPRAKLLNGVEWQQNRIQVCRSLGHPLKGGDALSRLVEQLENTYKRVVNNFPQNEAVTLVNSGKKPSLTITNLDRLEEPESLIELNQQVTALLPKVDLTELLLEIHEHTGFLNEFSHISETNARAKDLPISICAVLVAEACNIGFEPLIKSHIPALTRHRLSWVKQNYFRNESIVNANAKLVDHQATLPLAQQWGGGEVASADGIRFVTPVKTINSAANKKYFGAGRGITWYNFLSDQYSGFHGIVIPGTLRDSMFVLEGLLEQQTGLNPTEIMTDTTGTSDLVFGLFWLLGYQFSPRLADAGEAVFWKVDKDTDYGALNDVVRGVVKTEKILQQWDDMMRLAGSLKLGKIRASELISTLLKSTKPSSLAQAIIEAGKINKTIYLLNYIDDEDYRRRILTQLNRGEGRHAVARVICYGQRGEIRKRYREGQEDQLGALGLVTNAVVLWNTIYMQSAIEHLEDASEIKSEDKARLSPLGHAHINVLGHYSFTLEEQVSKGNLRPLNQLNEDSH